ncbi:MAG: hypothetical protein GKR89_21990 [Candidatus Latescibacteria bacterium]|nr:hypothetical protein [Candidatus Latescibacterota bacterium]
MQFTGICLVSQQVGAMRAFYRAILQSEPSGDDHWWVDFGDVPGGHFSIFNAQGMEDMAPGSMKGAGAGGYTVEFQVDDVDAEYTRLQALGVEIVKPPTTQTWGRRSLWFRDPDGNIVNFYVEAPGER